MEKLTVFTPTYNREKLLSRLYLSLLNQTNWDFEWIIVDDGSSDGTKEQVKNWINEEKLNIRYYQQPNSGKHIAYNKAVELCSNKWFFCVDSDDVLTKDAIQKVLKLVDIYSTEEDVIGFVGPKGNLKGERIYSNWPTVKTARFYDLYEKYRFIGETAIILKTDELKRFPFPKYDGEKFIPEAYLYRQLDQKGKFVLFNDIIYGFEYQPDGYSLNSLEMVKRNPVGYSGSEMMTVKYSRSTLTRIKAYAYYKAIKKSFDMGKPTKKDIPMNVRILSKFLYPYYRWKFI